MVRHRGHREFKILDALVEGQIKKDLSRAIGDLKKWGLDDSRALSRGKGDDFVNYQKGLMALKNEVQAGQRIAFWDMESVNTLYMAVKNLIQEDSTVLLFKELMLSLWSLEQTARDTDDINGKWFFAQRAVSYYDKLEECMRFIDVVSWLAEERQKQKQGSLRYGAYNTDHYPQGKWKTYSTYSASTKGLFCAECQAMFFDDDIPYV